eukprot:gb/GEZN01001680.1/.p1 GENE.gb/GEZN01001680.1/~~gb/GEZN01001680.1/.p1  ORF type:complete len:936 (-),score=172.77 gb/GEZN01001680.1/:76-2814(-)
MSSKDNSLAEPEKRDDGSVLAEAEAILRVVSPAGWKTVKRSNFDIPKFSDKLEKALAEVLPSDDPWDAPDFDTVAFINQAFPQEASITEMDAFLRMHGNQYQALCDGVNREVREHSIAKKTTDKAIQEATSAIHELMRRMGTIHKKAAQAELMVEDICSDIKSLDWARKHLLSTIRALRNLHMLVSACQQLNMFTAEKQYKDAANLFRAIADVFTLFDSYGNNPKIQTLKGSIEQSKSAITGSIVSEFHRELSENKFAADDALAAETFKYLNSACSIIDVVDPAVKHNLIAWFTKLQLDPYEKTFGRDQGQATLESIEKRYGWMRKTLRDYDMTYANIFPAKWDVPAIMARDFCAITHTQITEAIEKAKLDLDVNLLIRGLQKTNEFEREMNMLFRFTSGDTIGRFFKAGDTEDSETRTALAKLITAKYKQQSLEEKRNQPPNQASHASDISFDSRIGDAFMPYMAAFVELERNNLRDLVKKLEVEEQWVPVLEEEVSAEIEYAVDPTLGEEQLAEATAIKNCQHLAGADSLFLYIKNSLRRGCSLAKGQNLFNLFKEFQTGLGLYCSLLGSKIPFAEQDNKDNNKGGVSLLALRTARSQQQQQQQQEEECAGGLVPRGELRTALLIINTCQYVQETLPALEQGIKDVVDDIFKEYVTLEAVTEDFASLLHRAVKALVGAMTSAFNKGPLTQMTKMPWSTWSSVGDQSEYINLFHACLKLDVAEVRQVVSARYFALFCTQLASAVIPAFVAAIFKCKRVSNVGGHQLALDANALKSVLLSLPNMVKLSGADSAPPAAARGQFRAFHRYVAREMGKVEFLLKTLVCEPSHMAQTYVSLLPKSSANDLMKLMSLRGCDLVQQKAYIELYNATAEKKDRLVVEKRDKEGKNILLDKASKLLTSFDMSSRHTRESK